MPNISYKLALFTMCGALLAAGSNASDASNAYNARQAGYWACPAEIMAVTGKPQPGYPTCPAETMEMTAKADNLVPVTDAPVIDKPDHPGRSVEDERRYYDYSGVILGD